MNSSQKVRLEGASIALVAVILLIASIARVATLYKMHSRPPAPAAGVPDDPIRPETTAEKLDRIRARDEASTSYHK